MPFHLAIWASKVSKKFKLDRKIGFQNTFYIKCVNVIFDSIGPSIILRSIYTCSELRVLQVNWIKKSVAQVQINKNFLRKNVNIFLPISFNICFGCSK